MMKLYYYNDGLEPNRCDPKFTITADNNEELLEKFDSSFLFWNSEICYMLDGYDWRNTGQQDFEVIDAIDETHYGTIYITV